MGPELQSRTDDSSSRERPQKAETEGAGQVCSSSVVAPAAAQSPPSGTTGPVSGALAASLFGHYGEAARASSEKRASAASGASAEARAGAQELRAALISQVSVDSVMRLLNRHPERVRAAVTAYDAELSVTGSGLLADIDRMFGAAHAEVAAALLARAGAEHGQALTYTRSTGSGKGREDLGHLRIVASPRVAVAVPGSQIRYSIDQGDRMYSAGSYCTYQWFCLNDPQTSQAHDMQELVFGPSAPTWDARWSFPGNHKLLCRIRFRAREVDGTYTDHPPQFVEYQQSVHAQGDVLEGAIHKAPKRAAPSDQLRLMRAYQHALHAAGKQPGSGPVDSQRMASLDNQITKLGERLHSTEGHARIPLSAVHVTAENAKVSPLNVFVAHIGTSGGQEIWKLVDITNPTDRRLTGEYTGKGRDAQHAIQDAVSVWDSGNRYPKGRLRVRAPREAGFQLDQEVQTDGASFWDSISEFFSQVGFLSGLGMLGAAAVMTIAPDPTVSKVAAVLLWTSILTGTAGASINLAQRHAEGMSTVTEDAFDALTIAGNILGARWALGATVKGLSLAGSRAGTAVVIGRIGIDSAQGILLSVEHVKEYQQILADSDPQRRTDRLIQLLGKAALSGGMLTLSLHGSRADLARVKQKAGLTRLGNQGEVVDLARSPAAGREPEEAAHSFGSAPTLPQIPEGKIPEPQANKKPPALPEQSHGPLQNTEPQATQPARSGEQDSGRVKEPVPGLFESVDATRDHAPAGWSFHDEVKPAAEGWIRITTHCRDSKGRKGKLIRSYDPETKMYVMEAADFADDLERWIHGGTSMSERGTPLSTYLMIRQLKIVGAGFGELQTVKMSTIQNIEALLQLARSLKDGMDLANAVRFTHSVQYAETAMIQSGHRIVGVRVKTGRANTSPIDELLSFYETHRNWEVERDPKIVEKHDKLLAKYGIQRTDNVLWNYDIYLDLAPFTPKGP